MLVSAVVFATVIAPRTVAGGWFQPSDNRWVRTATVLMHAVIPVLGLVDDWLHPAEPAPGRWSLGSAAGSDYEHTQLQPEVHPVSRSRKQPGAMSATEFMAQLQKDKEYQARKAAFDAELQERASVLRAAEQPIVADLRATGVQIDSVWDLVNTSAPYPAALPVLVEHLERGGYPERVMESLGRALAVKPSVAFWERLKARWLGARNPGEEDGVAVALAGCADEAQLDDLIDFLSVEERGQSRIYFIRPILTLGGDRGREVVEALRGDPVFGKEASALLKRRGSSPA